MLRIQTQVFFFCAVPYCSRKCCLLFKFRQEFDCALLLVCDGFLIPSLPTVGTGTNRLKMGCSRRASRSHSLRQTTIYPYTRVTWLDWLNRKLDARNSIHTPQCRTVAFGQIQKNHTVSVAQKIRHSDVFTSCSYLDQLSFSRMEISQRVSHRWIVNQLVRCPCQTATKL